MDSTVKIDKLSRSCFHIQSIQFFPFPSTDELIHHGEVTTSRTTSPLSLWTNQQLRTEGDVNQVAPLDVIFRNAGVLTALVLGGTYMYLLYLDIFIWMHSWCQKSIPTRAQI